MGLTAYDQSGAPRTAVDCYVLPDGSTSRQVQTVTVSDGFGGWRLAWVPPVRVATVSFSKVGVTPGESFSVTLAVPGGTPEAAVVEFATGSWRHTERPARGTTAITVPGVSHTADGANGWTVTVRTAGGDTSFTGTQTVHGRSTVAVSGPGWALSRDSGAGGPMLHLVAPTFTAALSNPAAVAKVEWQIHYPTTGWQAPLQTDVNPTGNVTVTIPFLTTGNWHVRATITHKDGATVESNHHYILIQKKSLSIAASNGSPQVGSTVTFSAACHDDCPSRQVSSGFYYTTDGSPWTLHGGGGTWANVQGNSHWWTYREDFPDGSFISAPYVTVVPVVPWHVRSWHTQADAQWIVNQRAGQQVIFEPATYQFTSGKFYIPANTHIIATGCTFVVHQGIVNAGSGGGYSRAGGWIWDGGTFDGWNVRTTMFSLAHSPGFTIRNIRVRGCVGKGHGIEINSSGGPVQSGYTVVIEGCVFDGVMSRSTWTTRGGPARQRRTRRTTARCATTCWCRTTWWSTPTRTTRRATRWDSGCTSSRSARRRTRTARSRRPATGSRGRRPGRTRWGTWLGRRARWTTTRTSSCRAIASTSRRTAARTSAARFICVVRTPRSCRTTASCHRPARRLARTTRNTPRT
jgi:hypothetical protein